jgi:hypothetical protein
MLVVQSDTKLFEPFLPQKHTPCLSSLPFAGIGITLLIDALVLKPAIYIEPSPNVKTEKWSNFNVDLIGVPVVSEAPNFA